MIPIYNLLEYSDDYAKITRSLYQYPRNAPKTYPENSTNVNWKIKSKAKL